MQKPLTVLFFGVQGSGKGTQVKLLMEKIRAQSDAAIIHIDMGHLLRTMVGTGSYSGKLVNEVISVGKRMPDFMPTYLATNALVQGLQTGEEHIIADGLARGPDQTRGYDDAMTFFGRDNFQIISLELTDEESTKRLLARGRNDDTPEGIAQRLGWYKIDVLPQLEMLRSRGRTVHAINGNQSVDAVHADIMLALGL
ncbi:MAG: nucleoside monophosphate kinase [Minisyncoccia bacterium]